MSNAADRVLVERTLHGDEHGFAELFRRYRPAVWRTVRRRLGDPSESEDAMQEVFLRAFASLRNFDLERPFDHWIMRIARNYCIDVLRRRRNCPSWLGTTREGTLAEVSIHHQSRPSCWGAVEIEALALRLLDALKPHNRHAFVLRELDGLEYAEVGRMLQISPLAARVRVSRAKKEMCRNLRA